jgi:hypothetical protein
MRGSPVLQTLPPRLEETVQYGSDYELAGAFLGAPSSGRGSPVCVVSGTKNRQTLV